MMPRENLTFWDIVKAAFHLKVRLPGMGKMPINKYLLAGFGILGIGCPGLWFLGLAYECAYFLFLTSSRRFQNFVRATSLKEVKEDWQQRQQGILSGLDVNSQKRYGNLLSLCREIESAGGKDADVFSSVKNFKMEGLNQLLRIFITLLDSRKNILEIIGKVNAAEIERDMAAIKARMEKENESSTVYRSLKGSIDIQMRRVENLQKARESLSVTEAELERIEKQISLIAEETALSRNPELRSMRVDNVVQSLQGTAAWMREHAEFFSSLEEGEPPISPVAPRFDTMTTEPQAKKTAPPPAPPKMEKQ